MISMNFNVWKFAPQNVLNRYIVWWGLLANVTWSILVTIDPVVMHTTPLSTIANFFNHSQGALASALLLSSIASFSAMASDRLDLRTLILLMPQQFMMLMAAGGSILAMYNGYYADLVIRSSAFIIADQIPWVLAAVLFTASIIEHFCRKVRWTPTGLP